ncbi:MAG: pectate lyase [Paludibacteraceae bacterium]|nr:pectate lyase [Paludibacteraceae bacterium]
MKRFFLSYLIFYISSLLFAQSDGSIKLIKFKDGIHHWNLEHPNRNYHRFDRTEITAIADNFVAWQNYDGGWPKNIDWLAKIDIDSVKRVMNKKHRISTLDNRNTFPQIEYLSEAYFITKNETYRESAEKGIRYILSTQNPISGGWKGWDVNAITFNDEIMTGVMTLFLDIKEKEKIYTWINADLYKEICESLHKAIDVTLRCQIVQNGEKTAWCQQHSHKALYPINGRTFELASITANESSDVLLFLMRIKNPSKDIIAAVHAGVKWLEKSKLTGFKVERKPLPKNKYINNEYPFDLVVVEDATAKPIWARFYDLESNEPFLCNRNGERVYKLEDVSPERRTGYAWYGYWPEKVFKVYAEWKLRKDVN